MKYTYSQIKSIASFFSADPSTPAAKEYISACIIAMVRWNTPESDIELPSHLEQLKTVAELIDTSDPIYEDKELLIEKIEKAASVMKQEVPSVVFDEYDYPKDSGPLSMNQFGFFPAYPHSKIVDYSIFRHIRIALPIEESYRPLQINRNTPMSVNVFPMFRGAFAASKMESTNDSSTGFALTFSVKEEGTKEFHYWSGSIGMLFSPLPGQSKDELLKINKMHLHRETHYSIGNYLLVDLLVELGYPRDNIRPWAHHTLQEAERYADEYERELEQLRKANESKQLNATVAKPKLGIFRKTGSREIAGATILAYNGKALFGNYIVDKSPSAGVIRTNQRFAISMAHEPANFSINSIRFGQGEREERVQMGMILFAAEGGTAPIEGELEAEGEKVPFYSTVTFLCPFSTVEALQYVSIEVRNTFSRDGMFFIDAFITFSKRPVVSGVAKTPNPQPKHNEESVPIGGSVSMASLLGGESSRSNDDNMVLLSTNKELSASVYIDADPEDSPASSGEIDLSDILSDLRNDSANDDDDVLFKK